MRKLLTPRSIKSTKIFLKYTFPETYFCGSKLVTIVSTIIHCELKHHCFRPLSHPIEYQLIFSSDPKNAVHLSVIASGHFVMNVAKRCT